MTAHLAVRCRRRPEMAEARSRLLPLRRVTGWPSWKELRVVHRKLPATGDQVFHRSNHLRWVPHDYTPWGDTGCAHGTGADDRAAADSHPHQHHRVVPYEAAVFDRDGHLHRTRQNQLSVRGCIVTDDGAAGENAVSPDGDRVCRSHKDHTATHEGSWTDRHSVPSPVLGRAVGSSRI